MSEEFTVQCQQCGTIYSDREQVCPYCGQPSPPLVPDEAYLEPPDDLFPEEELLYSERGDAAAYPVEEEDWPVDEDAWPEDYLEEETAAAYDDELTAYEPAMVDEEEYYAEDAALAAAYDDFADEQTDNSDDEPEHRFRPRRIVAGCLALFLFIGLFFGALGALGVYQGLKERSLKVQAEAIAHYQKGQEHLANNSLDLAIAEFEMALSLNPNLLEARQALREAQQTVRAQPTPTSETRTAAAAALLAAAEAQVEQENWAEAVQTLIQLRDVDPDYRADYVSKLTFTANYQLALSLMSPDTLEDAVGYLEAALSERPEDAAVAAMLGRTLLYLDARDAQAGDKQTAITLFRQLYLDDSDFLDVKQQLVQTYVALGNELIDQGDWCEAEAQFVEAVLLQPDEALQSKAELVARRCQEMTEAAAASAEEKSSTPSARATSLAGALPTDTPIAPITPSAAMSTSGTIYFSAFNRNETRWEILSVPASGGAPQLVVSNGVMPALSPNGQLLVYRSEAIDSEGLHIFDLTTGEDRRITIFRQDMLPRWGGNSQEFLFVAQEPATGLWKIQQGFADGKGAPVILGDGRTPDWSPDNQLIAYQGTDRSGNNPGIYLSPFGGGEPTRLTNHESDRSPDFSPDGAQLVYMSTRGGNWDIYTVSVAGSQPRQITTSPGNDGLPVWSPDGTQIAYVSDQGGSWAIYTVSAGGGEPVRVADWDGVNREEWQVAQIWWGR